MIGEKIVGDGDDCVCCFLINAIIEQTASGAKCEVSKGHDSRAT